MQIRKMKDMGEQLYTTQMNGGHNSLTMSPKQPNSSRATRPDRQEAQSLLYQGSEAEAALMTIATCVKCKSVHKIPLQDLKKDTGQSQKEDKYVCLKCSIHVSPPPFHFMNNNTSAAYVGNNTETISSPVNKFKVARQLRLIAVKPDQLIKCPRRNQPVIVLNHPDVDSPEVTNVMKVINKYKGNVLKVVLSERTRCQLGIRRHHLRLTYQNTEEASQMKRQMMLKMKLKKVHKNNYQVVDSLPDDSSQCIFKCWFCGRLYEDQEEWMSHGQRHLIEATRDWDVLSSKGK